MPRAQPHVINIAMKRLLLVFTASFFLLCAGLVFYSFYRFNAAFTLTQPVSITIPPGTGKQQILSMLHEADLFPPLHVSAMPTLMQAASLKAGEYEFSGTLSPAIILQKIARGEVVIHKITVPEGWNIFQLRNALAAEEKLTGDLPVLSEGAYLPETYHFRRGESRRAILARMEKAMQEVLANAWRARAADLPITSPQQALILASIIERETAIAAERPLVASVYTNRLRRNMPLQADPTVAYGIEHARGAPLNRPLTRADLAHDHPWNTYTRSGLPASPIACPGAASIASALNPPATSYLYFVADGKGGHVFATTLGEHNRNVAAYRRKMREVSLP